MKVISDIVREDALNIIKANRLDELDDNKTFLITGASGMIGFYFLITIYELNKEFDKNHKIVALLRNKNKLPEEILEDENVFVIEQDVIDKINYEGDINYIIHCAGPASPVIMKKDPVGTNFANTFGTANCLNLAKEKNALGFLFISSREVYGQPKEDQKLFYEDQELGYLDHLLPRNGYAESKKNAENMCACFTEQYGLNTKAIRLAHTYGPGMSIYDGRVQADFLKNLMYKEDIIMKSKGEAVRTYTYIGDAVSAMFLALLKGPKDEIVYNVSDEENEVSIRDLANLIASLDEENNIKVVMDIPEEDKGSYAPFTLGILSSKKIRDLGHKSLYNIKDGFKRTVRHLEEELELEKEEVKVRKKR